MRGGAAMFLQSRRAVPTLREIEGFTWDVAPLPTINEAATVLHSDAFCMAAAAENKEAVWEFVEYAAGEEGQLVLAETGRIVPVLNSVAEIRRFPQRSAYRCRQLFSHDTAPGQLAGLHRQHPEHPPAADDLDLDRGRGRLQRRVRSGLLRADRHRRRGPDGDGEHGADL